MKRYSYRERDHAFGQLILELRTAIGLTQKGLADTLGISRYAIGGWEAGEFYPKIQHLKHFIALGVQQHAFHSGREAEEIRELWRAAHQKVLLDEPWLEALLNQQRTTRQPAPSLESQKAPASDEPSVSIQTPFDWSDAPVVSAFYGRAEELALLVRWVGAERCRIVCVAGMGGIGKSALAVTAMRQVATDFEVVIWRSLNDAPSCETLLDTCLQVLAPESLMRLSDSLDARLSLLMKQLRNRRVLLVLDNWEELLEESAGTGQMRDGFESYARLLRQIGESAHQSCLLLTSREKPVDLVPLEGNRRLVRVLKIAGIDMAAGTQLLAEEDLDSSGQDQATLIELYGGNPLALKMIAQTIINVFGGDTNLFLAQGNVVFGGVRQLLDGQFDHLSALEQNIVFWLAILREPVMLEDLLAVLRKPQAPAHILEALDALNRRSLIAGGPRPGSFALHAVVLGYATARIVAEASSELVEGALDRLIAHSLTQARANDYIRKAQEQLLLVPVLHQLRQTYPEPASLEAHLLGLLDELRSKDHFAQGYGPANLLALLHVLRGNLRGLDLSRLMLRGVFLQNVAMQDTLLAGATLHDSVFTEAFDAISAVAVSSTGEYWAAATWRGEVRLWKAIGPTLHGIWQAHTIYISSLAFSPNGQSLASVSWDNTVKLWDVASGALHWMTAQTGGINCVSFSPNGHLLASAGGDGLVSVWDAHSGAQMQTLAGQSGAVFGLAWSPDGSILATGSATGMISLWQYKAPDRWFLVHEQIGHTQRVAGLAFAGDGRMLASASFDGTIKVWDAASYACLHTLSSHAGQVVRVAWSPDGSILASCTFDHAIWLWDMAEMRPRTILRGHSSVIYGLGFAPDGRTLLSGSDDGTMRVWDAIRGQTLHVIQGYVATLFDIDWNPEDTQLASAGADTLVTIWQRNDSTSPTTFHGHHWIVQGLAWHPRGQLIASSGYDNSIRLWDTATGICVKELRDQEVLDTIFLGVAWSPDGQLLASGSYHRGVYVWDVDTSAPLWVGQADPALIRQVAWSPDGTRLVGGGDNGYIYMWDVPHRMLLHRLAGHSGNVTSVAWNPEGMLLASGGGNGTQGGEVFVWDARDGKRMHTLVGYAGVVFAVAWSLDGRLLVSGSSDGMVRWWDATNGTCLRALAAHRGIVQALTISHDGKILASCGDDGTVILWDLHTGEQLQTLRRDRPYERMDITGLSGITDAQRASLIALGAVEEREHLRPTGREKVESSSNQALLLPQTEPLANRSPANVRNLPFQPTTFVGRDAELAEITTRLLDPACRLLTLLGPGGIGKTRLALQVAAAQDAAFADGVVFVALAPLDTPSQIVLAINDTLGLSPANHPDPFMPLLNYLGERHMLLVLDNFEHLLDGADLVATMLAQTPNLSLLVTSRERLHVQAEWLFDVGELAYPTQHQDDKTSLPHQNEHSTYSAIQLFVQRAMQVQPALVLDEAAMLAITRICQHVAGIPLAIELAAAGTYTLSLVEIEQQIRTNMDVLETTLRDVPSRHRSLRAVFDHSWKLLDEHERALFSRLAVFRGGWSARAAVEVAGITLPMLAGLADKSLIRRSNVTEMNHHAARELRWTMLEPLREYALEQLAIHHEAATIQYAHAQYFLALAETVATQWGTAAFEQAVTQLRREYDNIRAALAWARDNDGMLGLQLAEALWQFWRSYGYISEGRAWLEQLLALEPTTNQSILEMRQQAMHAAAWLASDQHDYAEATRLFDASAPLRQVPDQINLDTDLLLNAARQARAEGEYGRATVLLEQALAWHRAQEHSNAKGSMPLDAVQQAFGQALREYGLMTREQGNFVRAKAIFEESFAFHHAVGDRACEALALIGLADVARDQGDHELVQEYGEEALLIVRELGMPWAIGFTLNTLALGTYYRGEFVQAATLIHESEAVFRALHADGALTEILITMGKIERAQGKMAAAYAAMAEALRLALAVGPRLFVAASLEGLGSITAAQGQAEESLQLLAHAAALRGRMGTPAWPADQGSMNAAVITVRSFLGDNAFTEAWAKVQAMPLDQLLSTVLDAA